MSNKLQNIKAVKQLLSGEHRSQTRKSVYTGKTKKSPEDHEVLERDDQGKPKVWIERDAAGFGTKVTQHDGFRSREPEMNLLKNIRKSLEVPEKCPSCGKNMRDHEKHLNFKFWFKRKKCFDCVLKEEQKIKSQGPEAWKEYEKKIMLANAESWFKDTDKEVELVKQQTKEIYYQNADGKLGEMDLSAFLEKIENDYKQLKNDIRKSFE